MSHKLRDVVIVKISQNRNRISTGTEKLLMLLDQGDWCNLDRLKA